MRLEINYRKKTEKNSNTWGLNNMLLNNQETTEEIKEENIGRTLFDINHSKIFFDPPLRAMEIKT